jgi:hypothetical protein
MDAFAVLPGPGPGGPAAVFEADAGEKGINGGNGLGACCD